MLQSIRDQAQGVAVAIIIGIICLAFATWGLTEYLNAGIRVVVADVNGEELELSEFQREFRLLRQQAQVVMGSRFDADEWNSETAKSRVLDSIVEKKLLLQTANRAQMRISDTQLVDMIRRAPDFQENGGFSQARFSNAARSLGFSAQALESELRDDSVLRQLQTGIALSAFVTDSEVERLAVLEEQTRDLGYALIGRELLKDEIEVSDSDAEDYYQANRERFRTLDSFELEYVELLRDSLLEEVPVNEELLESYYQSHIADYEVEEERSASHVLKSLAQNASADDRLSAQAEMAIYRQRIEEGADFADLARENSDDSGSAPEGGSLGFFGRGVMAKPFEDAVFGMDVGEVSEIVETEFGLHLIRLDEIKPGERKSFEEVRDAVERTYREEEVRAIYDDQIERLAETSYENPLDLAVSADVLGLEIGKTEALSQAGIAERFSARVAEAVVSPEQLVEGLNSEVFDVSDGRAVVVRVASHEPSRIREFEEVKDQAREQVRIARASDALREYAQGLVARLRDGESLESLVEAEGLEWEDHDNVGRRSADANRAVTRAAFRVPFKAGSAPVYDMLELGSGDVAVLTVRGVSTPDANVIDPQTKEAVRSRLTRISVDAAWRRFVEGVKAQAEIEVFPAKL